MEENIST